MNTAVDYSKSKPERTVKCCSLESCLVHVCKLSKATCEDVMSPELIGKIPQSCWIVWHLKLEK